MSLEKFGTHYTVRPRKITISAYYENTQYHQNNAGRSSIVEFNAGMAHRLGDCIDNFRSDFRVFVTLTYPDAWPKDGRAVKGHWRAFIERLRRTGWFDKESLIWFLEFQERGAPHFHFLATGWIQKDWVARSWSEVTMGNIKSCSRVEALRNPDAAGAYAKKYAAKAEQKKVPAGYKDVGRFWGYSGKKILHGVPRQPAMAAAIRGRLPRDTEKELILICGIHKTKLTENEKGFTIYGNRRAIAATWEDIWQRSVITNLIDQNVESSLQQLAAGLWRTAKMRDLQILKSAKKYQDWRNLSVVTATVNGLEYSLQPE